MKMDTRSMQLYPAEYEEPNQPEKIKDQIYAQLTSTGNTIFKVKEFFIDTDTKKPRISTEKPS